MERSREIIDILIEIIWIGNFRQFFTFENGSHSMPQLTNILFKTKKIKIS